MVTFKFIWIYAIICIYPLLLQGQQAKMPYNNRSDSILKQKNPGRALVEILGANLGVWAVDRYLLNSDFSYITKRTIENNLKRGFVWDSDLFGTNLILHPYHGSLYYNAARSNGLSFYESISFTLTGSLSWEYLFENELPSKNDLMATTAGGIILGEITHRLANRILDGSTTGKNRVLREIFAGIISPMNGLNRIFSGEAWKHSTSSSPDRTPIDLNINTGIHVLKPEIKSNYLPYALLGVKLEYNPTRHECEQPFDWFEFGLQINIRPGSSYISQMHASGLLWNKTLHDRNNKKVDFGIYQHLDYRDAPSKVFQRTPYRIAQVLAIGPGIQYNNRTKTGLNLTGKAFLTGIGLGANLSDHYWVVDRDYNFSSGFSTQVQVKATNRDNRFHFGITAENYNLFTWKGYEANRNLYIENLKMFNVQGDKGYTNFTSIEAEIGYWFDPNWNISLIPTYLTRSTHYANFPTVNYSGWEFTLKFGYNIGI